MSDFGRLAQGLSFVTQQESSIFNYQAQNIDGKIEQPTATTDDTSVFRSLSTSVRSLLTGSAEAEQQPVTSIWSLNTTTITYFAVSAGIGVVLISLSFLFLPMLVFAPQKFLLLFTLGSLAILNSLAVVQGYTFLLTHMFSKHKLPFTLAYVLSLMATVYVTLVHPSYLLTLICTIVQLGALGSFLVSYVPGGVPFLTMIKDSALAFFWSYFGRDTGSVLPL